MSIEENKALVRKAYEFLNRKKLSDFFDLLASDYVEHMLNGDVQLEESKQYEQMWSAAFPDFHVTIIDMIAEDDKVAVRLNWKGTHLGEFMGIAPTNNRIDFLAANTIKIANGKLAELWNVADTLRIMQQLGAIPKQ